MATINLGNIKFNWKGTYNAGTAYAIDDVVSYNGSSYIAKTATTGNLPTVTANWDLMSQKGTDADLLNITSTAQGDIYYNNGSAIARLGAGTSGQFLKTQGTSANPVWADNTSVEYKVATNNTTASATYNGTQSSYTDHITQAITITQTCAVICNADFQHSYESGSVNMAGRFTLTPSSGSDLSTNPQQFALYGIGDNRAFGSHNLYGAFQNVPAGSWTVKLQIRNDGSSGSSGILNYFRGGTGTEGDRIYILYK